MAEGDKQSQSQSSGSSGSSGSSSSGSSGSSRRDPVQASVSRAKEAAQAEEDRQQDLVREQAELAEAAHRDYQDSEQGAVAREIVEVEKDIRSTGPSKGSVVGDPLKGPST